MNITYGTTTFDFSKLPEASTVAILKRGLTHFLGNEQASKVAGWKARFAKTEGREATEAEIDEQRAAYVASAIEALQNGTVGTHVRGPSVDPVEAAMEKIARNEINLVLKSNGAKFIGKGEDRKVTFADGSAFTMDELIERRLGNAEHGARIRKEAEKALKAAAKTAEAAKAQGPVSADLIG